MEEVDARLGKKEADEFYSKYEVKEVIGKYVFCYTIYCYITVCHSNPESQTPTAIASDYIYKFTRTNCISD